MRARQEDPFLAQCTREEAEMTKRSESPYSDQPLMAEALAFGYMAPTTVSAPVVVK